MSRLKSEIVQLETQINSDRLKISNGLQQLRTKIDTLSTSPYAIGGGLLVGFSIVYWGWHKKLRPVITKVKNRRDKIAQSDYLSLTKAVLANVSIGISLIRLISSWL